MSEDTRIDTILARAAGRLAAISDSARLDAELLLARTIDVPRSYLYAHPEEILDRASRERLNRLLERRLTGEPMAYITGTREFWSLELHVSPATLIPRPETELVVELALREIPRGTELRVLDLGTGSGAIGLAIARDRPSCRVTATDSSSAALDVARINAREHAIANVEFVEGDWTEPVTGRVFDLIVSNPPYVAAGDAALDALTAEPETALVAGVDGLDAIRVLVRDCPPLLSGGGGMLLEHGADQADAVADLLAAGPWVDVECRRDHAGLPRVTSARRP